MTKVTMGMVPKEEEISCRGRIEDRIERIEETERFE
jgi:hypothetical protein